MIYYSCDIIHLNVQQKILTKQQFAVGHSGFLIPKCNQWLCLVVNPLYLRLCVHLQLNKDLNMYIAHIQFMCSWLDGLDVVFLNQDSVSCNLVILRGLSGFFGVVAVEFIHFKDIKNVDFGNFKCCDRFILVSQPNSGLLHLHMHIFGSGIKSSLESSSYF